MFSWKKKASALPTVKCQQGNLQYGRKVFAFLGIFTYDGPNGEPRRKQLSGIDVYDIDTDTWYPIENTGAWYYSGVVTSTHYLNIDV